MDKMILRPMHMDDLKQVRDWEPNRSDFDFRNLTDAAVIETSTGVIGYGAIKLFSEGFVALKPSIPQITKAHAFKMLLATCVDICVARGIERLHVFPDTNEYAEKLLKLGFQPAEHKVLALKIGE